MTKLMLTLLSVCATCYAVRYEYEESRRVMTRPSRVSCAAPQRWAPEEEVTQTKVVRKKASPRRARTTVRETTVRKSGPRRASVRTKKTSVSGVEQYAANPDIIREVGEENITFADPRAQEEFHKAVIEERPVTGSKKNGMKKEVVEEEMVYHTNM